MSPDRGPGAGPPAPEVPGRDGADSFVRPFAMTGGRTRATLTLRLETMVEVAAHTDPATLGPEVQPLLHACARALSVAELVNELHLPVGVVKILVSDLVESGDLVLQDSAAANLDVSLVDRILDGVRAL